MLRVALLNSLTIYNAARATGNVENRSLCRIIHFYSRGVFFQRKEEEI